MILNMNPNQDAESGMPLVSKEDELEADDEEAEVEDIKKLKKRMRC